VQWPLEGMTPALSAKDVAGLAFEAALKPK
jgi:hypothetical protein